ncbi:cytochrome P450 [Mycena amicta]|nr:cytochrome P450 [Mycena amicta]
MPLVTLTAFVVALALGVLSYVLLISHRSRNRLPLPPGPRKLPFLGNMLHIPTQHQWETYVCAGTRNSDLLHLDVAGASILVLGSLDAANDLFDKRSNVYSDRMPMTMVNELMGWDFIVGFMRYGETWRKARRLLHREFESVHKSYQTHQRTAVRRFLRRLLHVARQAKGNAVDIAALFRFMTGDMILASTYGIDVLQPPAYLIMAEASVAALFRAAEPGRFLVDYMPILKYVPSWLPAAGFQRSAKIWREGAFSMRDVPFTETKRQMTAGIASHSFVSALLEDPDEFDLDASRSQEEYEYHVKSAAASAYVGGTDTTLSMLSFFLVAMMQYPEVQRKAQADVDRVIGAHGERLPEFSDRDEMPYISALVKEVLRWVPTVPLGVPRLLAREDVYRGAIAHNEACLPSVYAITTNATRPNSHIFNPERWLMLDGTLNTSLPDSEIVFGFGRRVCPGQQFALSSIWLTFVSLLATVDIGTVNGDVYDQERDRPKYSDGLVVSATSSV